MTCLWLPTTIDDMGTTLLARQYRHVMSCVLSYTCLNDRIEQHVLETLETENTTKRVYAMTVCEGMGIPLVKVREQATTLCSDM